MLTEKFEASRSSRLVRRTCSLFCLALFISASVGHAVTLARADAQRIGRKVWQNECAGTIAGLTSWNAGENFASLGIGHFIWYPKGVRGPFQESFPDFVSFASSRGSKLPSVLAENRNMGCPWSTRADFLEANNSARLQELRRFLSETIDLQTDFLVQRLQKSLPKMLEAAASAGGPHVQRQFDSMAGTPEGCYALVDYVNFKGEGVLDTERYHGQGWGLLQVLSGMNEDSKNPTSEFAASAARVLKQRVQNSPPERHEARWLAGWLQRVHTYAH